MSPDCKSPRFFFSSHLISSHHSPYKINQSGNFDFPEDTDGTQLSTSFDNNEISA